MTSVEAARSRMEFITDLTAAGETEPALRNLVAAARQLRDTVAQ